MADLNPDDLDRVAEKLAELEWLLNGAPDTAVVGEAVAALRAAAGTIRILGMITAQGRPVIDQRHSRVVWDRFPLILRAIEHWVADPTPRVGGLRIMGEWEIGIYGGVILKMTSTGILDRQSVVQWYRMDAHVLQDEKSLVESTMMGMEMMHARLVESLRLAWLEAGSPGPSRSSSETGW